MSEFVRIPFPQRVYISMDLIILIYAFIHAICTVKGFYVSALPSSEYPKIKVLKTFYMFFVGEKVLMQVI